ncbi:uncharacterized protein LOC118205795 [Stegodyphus dumicola]|uniref:uncharacterized protein LOC118205795 n=1 Tax=Stegodyphus dumicola TaxID=202533 RepID=UPI0015AE3982|nr:uncharacterized protein LOC118205795 [Stegodyphus dumicola]
MPIPRNSGSRDLISGMQLSDKKPSSLLLLEMQSKVGSRMSEDLLKSLFLQQLPTHAQQILAISSDKLDKLAEMADGIMAATGNSASVFEVKTEDSALKELLMDISSRLSRMETRSRSRSTEREQQNKRGRSSSRQRQGNREHCWYHQRFKEKATKCTKPCTFQAEN